MKDEKVIETLERWEEHAKYMYLHAHNPLLMMAEAVSMSREFSLPIEEVAKCFKAQYQEPELRKLIEELQK